MANTTFQGVVRSYGGGSKGTHVPGVMVQSVQISFDPTATSAADVRIGTSASSGETSYFACWCYRYVNYDSQRSHWWYKPNCRYRHIC